jgi:hypothetical protein
MEGNREEKGNKGVRGRRKGIGGEDSGSKGNKGIRRREGNGGEERWKRGIKG